MPNRRELLGAVGAAAALGASPALARPRPKLLARLDADLRRHAELGNKRSGSAGDDATARWIGERLGHSGFAVERVDFDVPCFEPGVAQVLADGAAIEVAPQPIVVPTPAGGIEAPGILVRDSFDAAGASGKVAFLVLPFDRHAAIFSAVILPLLNATVAAGAKAVVIVPTGPTGLIVGLNTRLKPMAPVPIASMAPRDLPAVARCIAGGGNLTLTVTGRGFTRQSCNLIATRRAGPEWLVFSTPRTGWYDCVGERAPGTAAFLELCDWAARRYPRHSLFAINGGGHELDFIGMHKALPLAPPPEHTLAWAHLGAGIATRDQLQLGINDFGLLPSADPLRVLMTSRALHQDARRAFAGLSGLERPIVPIPGAGELSGIIDRGYARAFAVLGVHRWCHTPEDTLDKVDAGLLLPVVEAHKALFEVAVASARR